MKINTPPIPFNPAVPGAIGGTTPSTATFTAVLANGLQVTSGGAVGTGKITYDGSNMWHVNIGTGGAVFNDSANTLNAFFISPAGGITAGSTTDAGAGNILAGGTVSGVHVATGTATSCTGATIGAGSKNNAGFVTATTTGVSTIVLTFSVTAATGWVVEVSNRTTANLTRQSASTTTTATFTGTTVTGDVLSYIAVPF